MSKMKNLSENIEKSMGSIWSLVVLPVVAYWGLWFFVLLFERLGK
jgi:hypothetical protein